MAAADVICMSLDSIFRRRFRTFQEQLALPQILPFRGIRRLPQDMRLYDTYAVALRAQTEDRGGALLVAGKRNGSRATRTSGIRFSAAPPAAGDGIISVGPLIIMPGVLRVAPFLIRGASWSALEFGILSAHLGAGSRSRKARAWPHLTSRAFAALWTRHEFPKGERRAGWADTVRTKLRSTARSFGASFENVGHRYRASSTVAELNELSVMIVFQCSRPQAGENIHEMIGRLPRVSFRFSPRSRSWSISPMYLFRPEKLSDKSVQDQMRLLFRYASRAPLRSSARSAADKHIASADVDVIESVGRFTIRFEFHCNVLSVTAAKMHSGSVPVISQISTSQRTDAHSEEC